jgi:hypothetical protein
LMFTAFFLFRIAGAQTKGESMPLFGSRLIYAKLCSGELDG